MYYFMQVISGSENKIRRLLAPLLHGDEECFIPKVMRKYKVRGNFEMRKIPLLPGYMFVKSDRIEHLFFDLKQVPELTKLLRCDDYFYPVGDSDLQRLLPLMDDSYTVNMSYGYKQGSQVVITDGPMLGMQGSIKRIDRHHRTAWLEIELFGRKTEIQLGLEVIGGGEGLEEEKKL